MKRLAVTIMLLFLSAGAASAILTAKDLIEKVEQARRTSGFRIRARLIRTTTDSKKPEIQQLLIKGRRQGETTQVLYQVLWPKAAAGRALLVETSADGKIGGFLFDPPAAPVPLTPTTMTRPLFGSDLTVEDVAEAFWRWPSQVLAGEATVSGRLCQILESRPGGGEEGDTSLVKSWIAPDIALPLRIEKFGRDGRLARSFVTAKIVKQSAGHWAAAILVVQTADGHSRTVLEGSRSDRDIEIPAEQFTVQAINPPTR